VIGPFSNLLAIAILLQLWLLISLEYVVSFFILIMAINDGEGQRK